MKEVLLNLINLPLRILLSIGILALLLFKREVPEALWDIINIPKMTRVIKLPRK